VTTSKMGLFRRRLLVLLFTIINKAVVSSVEILNFANFVWNLIFEISALPPTEYVPCYDNGVVPAASNQFLALPVVPGR
jgi:hypothetical protein